MVKRRDKIQRPPWQQQDQDATAAEPPAQHRRLSPVSVQENFQQHSQVVQSSVALSNHVQLEHL